MDVPPALAAAVPSGASAYLVTVAPDGRPHTAPTSAVVRDDPVVVVADPGRRTLANVAAGSTVTVLWSPADRGDYSLIVDGTGETRDEALVVRPTRAVLHRAAPPGPDGSEPAPAGTCTADCVEVALA